MGILAYICKIKQSVQLPHHEVYMRSACSSLLSNGFDHLPVKSADLRSGCCYG